jgi:hypothetical protein
MTDESATEKPSGRKTTANANPINALRREELKYAHRSRRDTPAIRAGRDLLAEHIAAIEPEPVSKPTGQPLRLADRYRPRRPSTRT